MCFIPCVLFSRIKWWAQSFLVGVPTIVCGMRDKAYVVNEVKLFRVRDLPGVSTFFLTT